MVQARYRIDPRVLLSLCRSIGHLSFRDADRSFNVIEFERVSAAITRGIRFELTKNKIGANFFFPEKSDRYDLSILSREFRNREFEFARSFKNEILHGLRSLTLTIVFHTHTHTGIFHVFLARISHPYRRTIFQVDTPPPRKILQIFE